MSLIKKLRDAREVAADTTFDKEIQEQVNILLKYIVYEIKTAVMNSRSETTVDLPHSFEMRNNYDLVIAMKLIHYGVAKALEEAGYEFIYYKPKKSNELPKLKISWPTRKFKSFIKHVDGYINSKTEG